MLRAQLTCETPDYWKEHFKKHGVENPPPFIESCGPGMVKIASLNAHLWLNLPKDFEKRYPKIDMLVPALVARVPEEGRSEDGGVRAFYEDLPGAPQSVYLQSYGVIDHPGQFREYFGQVLEDDPRDFFVALTEIRKDEEEAEDGWRWHKWGPYYGTQKPQCEYIYDEPEIERVYLFQIYEL
jgi:hypothetical protein